MIRKRGLVIALTLALVGTAVGVGSRGRAFGPAPAEAQPARGGRGSGPATPTAPDDGTPREAIVARVADKTITLGDLERRLRAMPPFMLKRYGSTSEEIKKRFLDEVLVREIVLTQGALGQGLEKRPEIDDKMKAILRSALFEQLKKGTENQAITDEDVKKFYDENADKYVSPKRISIWRILVGSEPEARAIIDDMKKGDDVKKWNQVARDKSLDKASAMRSGNLGFVNPDGSTAQPELRLDVAIFDAADKVKDGEIVSEPVKEGDKWAVVWRRQAMRAVTRPLDAESPTIRSALADEKMRKAVDELITSLRTNNVSEMHPELCDMVSVTDTGDIEKAKRPGLLPKARQNGQPAPADGPAGLR